MQKRIALSDVYPNPDQPRKTFEPGQLAELAASIEQNGLIQQITVRPDDSGRYMIIAGERRWRAHKLLQEQGKADTILCNVSKVDDEQLAVHAIIENDQRVDVSPLEQARSYQRMIDVHGYTVESLATKLGKSAHRVQERLDLLRLNADAMFLFEKGQITATHAFYIASLPTELQPQLIKAIGSGQCNTMPALRGVCEAIREAAAQCTMFGDPQPEATAAEQRAAKTLDDKIEQVAALLRSCISDNEIVAAKKVDPNRAALLADTLKAMQVDMRRIETALRVTAVQMALVA